MTWPQAGEPGNSPYFFLSYAHTPRLEGNDRDPDRWVGKLFRDLCSDIVNITSVHPAQAGFMDRDIHVGAEWPRRLAAALATCRVFVPLYSPRYFDSDQCGREWLAFAQRIAEHKARNGGDCDAIVPALWVAVQPSGLPDVAKLIQFDHQALGTRYSEEGFYGIIKLGRYRDGYLQTVWRLARRIVEVANRTMLAPVPPVDYLAYASAFGSNNSSHLSGKRIEIIVAAPDLTSLPSGRNDFYYGASARDWNPFRPESAPSLADCAAEVARGLGFRPVISTITEYLARPTGGLPSAPGLLLVDAWAVATEAGERQLRHFTKRASCVVPLVPMNELDAETASARETLLRGLNACLSRPLSQVPVEYAMAAHGIPTFGQFSGILRPLAYAAYRKYLQEALPHPQDAPPRGPE